jgi:hypothetical protein
MKIDADVFHFFHQNHSQYIEFGFNDGSFKVFLPIFNSKKVQVAFRNRNSKGFYFCW